MKNLFLTMAAVTAAFVTTAARAETVNCIEIASVPVVITVHGIYCLKSDQASSLTGGNMIDIQANNVTIDLNGFKLGGLGAGPGTRANGIFAQDRKNITIRNGSIRGFFRGVDLVVASSSGDVVEGLLLDGNRAIGILVQGSGHVIRNNRVVNTGPGDLSSGADGIVVSVAQNVVVADNIISGTSETNIASGIFVFASELVEVRGNTVLDTKDATTTRGIEVFNSTAVTVIGNRIADVPATGDAGIINVNGSTSLVCRDNTVVGFTAALSGCDIDSGNVSLP